MKAVEIDMGEVASETAANLGAQIGQLTAELIAQRKVNEELHRRLAQYEDATDEQKAPPES